MAFESLSNKLQDVFKQLRGKGKLTEKDVKTAIVKLNWLSLRPMLILKLLKIL